MENFNMPAIAAHLRTRLQQINFTKPTPIQAEAIPPALAGEDILGSAQTGTGKTGAFLIPILTKLIEQGNAQALILLPTRELAMQVRKAAIEFLGDYKLTSCLLIGGDDMQKQLFQLKKKPRLIIGTPGRINDHLKRKSLNLKHTNMLILDEVDRMLDMGFGIQLDEINKYLPEFRQTLMFSATLPKNIEKLAARFLKDPKRIAVGSLNTPVTNIKQQQFKLKEDEKFPKLVAELAARNGSKIIFVKTKMGADKMALKLKKEGHKAAALHGDLRQNKRAQVIANFQRQKSDILVATDIAARGLDIPHIAHVINYDLPQNPEDYIHRIGRTARNGAEGEAINFLSPSDNFKWKLIDKLLNPESYKNDNGGKKTSNNRRNNNKPKFSDKFKNKKKPSGSKNAKFGKFGKNRKPADKAKKVANFK